MSIGDYRLLLESALAYSGGTHTFEDVVRDVESGEAQFWAGPNSCIVTQIDALPSRKVLLFFLAAGTREELKAMEPGIIEWGRTEGCTLARLLGRRGWERSFLTDVGWVKSDHIILEKEF
jgi:hypothetical protein